MYSLDELKQLAEKSYHFHGHRMVEWVTSRDNTWAYCSCIPCHAGAYVSVKLVNDAPQITGNAVLVDCTSKAKE